MRALIEEPTGRDAAEARTSIAVIRAVASKEGVDPTDLDVPLYDAVDPSALDSLFQSGFDGHVRFTYYGYEVSVFDDGRVLLEAIR